ncbi:acetaldehyde dehydrogenase (acetylating) [Burkholderia perseverans]|uniref:acetaldehyde dehydrogenase (acetylating) n=1 Tax=Burkholderia perseverans TaxID=2615214 RepID=UPI001FEFCD2A|nr:acetaldehyde dehydrogenase (acetylating) [Burkholderia perseverans]
MKNRSTRAERQVRAAGTARTRVAILGSGSIGIDLMFKVKACEQFDLAFVVGRNADSDGLRLARECHVATSSDGLDFLRANADAYDLVFDATSAAAHTQHNRFFAEAGKFAIDLTPAKVGRLCVPCINLPDTHAVQNVNLITCGGQASLPLAYALRQAVDEIDYLEVVSAIASRSAGMATRENINEYQTTTEYALAKFSGAKRTKAILNINPAEPGIQMQTTLYAHARYRDFGRVRSRIEAMAEQVREYVPGYQLVVQPLESQGRITVSLTVRGRGDYLPEYAGNLDIINCAALAVATHRHATLRSGATQ